MVNLTASYSPKHFLLIALSNYYLADSRILYFWQVMEYIHKFIIKLHTLQCFLVRRFNEQQGRGRIISNITKGRNFPSFMTTKCSWRLSHSAGPLFAPSKKGLSLIVSLAKKKIYMSNQLKRELTDLFWKSPGCSLFPQAP